MKKFASRKFLLSLAAFLSSVGAAITGMATDNEVLSVVGAVCAALSAGIYAAMEAYVDGQAVKASITTITTETTKTE